MAEKSKSKGLGRGLSALLAEVETPANEAQSDAGRSRGNLMIPIEKVRANPDQPRRTFEPKAMEDLISSIREKGIIQPLIVRRDPDHAGDYQIVAGERRWRAAQAVQLHEVPALVRELDDTEVLELAIIENIQRSDLNAVEEAQGYRQLMDRFGHTQEKLAEALGKSRSHIANLLRLLNLPDAVLDHVKHGRLSSGHARALVTSENAEAMAQEIISKGLSVRQTESLVKSGLSGSTPKPASQKIEKDADTRAVEGDLSAQLGMKVSIDAKSGDGAGSMTIRYKDLDQLDTLLQLLSQ